MRAIGSNLWVAFRCEVCSESARIQLEGSCFPVVGVPVAFFSHRGMIKVAVQQMLRPTDCCLIKKCLELRVASPRWPRCITRRWTSVSRNYKSCVGARSLIIFGRVTRQDASLVPSRGMKDGVTGRDEVQDKKQGEDEEVNLLRDCLRRQLDEMDVVRATYPEAFWMSDEESNRALELMEVLDARKAKPRSDLRLCFSVHLVGPQVGAIGHVSVEVTFPPHYPVREAPIVKLQCGSGISEQQLLMMSSGVQAAANDRHGVESVLHVLKAVQELANSSEEEADCQETIDAQAHARIFSRDSRFLQRRAVWFHHIRSPLKKRCIKEWSESLNIGGYVKVGRPGVLIFEGESENVHEYMKRIRKLKWQAMELRGVEQEKPTLGQDLDELRRFPIGVKQLPDEALNELRIRCCEENLEHLFLLALKVRTQG